MALVIFLLPSLHCLTLSFQAFFSYLHWHFRELGIPKIKVSNDHFFCVWENGFLTLLTRLDFLSIWTFFLFNYEISHIASNTLHIFSFNILAVCSCHLRFTPKLCGWPVFLNIRPRLAPGFSRSPAASVHSSLSDAVCKWLLTVCFVF